MINNIFKYKVIRYLTTGSILTASLFVSEFAFSEDSVRLNFGVYSSNKPTAMVRTFKPILNELENSMSLKLGRSVDIRMQIAKNYDQGVADLANGKVDFSRFGPASYVEAKRENDGLEILAMENVKGDKVFYGIIAVHKDSPIKDVSQLASQSFAFGDESSTIGRYLSQLFLENNGIRAGDLRKFEYLGRHDKVGTAVGAGDFEAGALNESTFKKLVASGVPIRELARFPNVTKPWIARKGLSPEVFTALQTSLYELKDENKLKSLKVVGFLPGSDRDYQTIRKAMENNDLFFKIDDNKPVPVPAAALSEQYSSNNTNSLESPPAQIQINLNFKDSLADLKNRISSTDEPLIVNVLINGKAASDSGVVVTQTESD